MSFPRIIIVSNTFSLIRRVTFFSSKTLMNINASFFFIRYIKLLSIKKFERFKKRVKFELEIAARDVLFK